MVYGSDAATPKSAAPPTPAKPQQLVALLHMIGVSRNRLIGSTHAAQKAFASPASPTMIATTMPLRPIAFAPLTARTRSSPSTATRLSSVPRQVHQGFYTRLLHESRSNDHGRHIDLVSQSCTSVPSKIASEPAKQHNPTAKQERNYTHWPTAECDDVRHLLQSNKSGPGKVRFTW